MGGGIAFTIWGKWKCVFIKRIVVDGSEDGSHPECLLMNHISHRDVELIDPPLESG